MSVDIPSESDWRLLVAFSEQLFDLPDDYTDDDVNESFREIARESHPDVSDLDEDVARKTFSVANFAEDILSGEKGREDIINADQRLADFREVLSDDEIQQAQRTVSKKGRRGERTTTQTAGFTGEEDINAPSDFDSDLFGNVTGQERKDLIREVSIGFSVLLRFNAVQGLLKRGTEQEQFYALVNRYIDENNVNVMTNHDYYEAVRPIIRDNVDKEVFIESIERIEDSLGDEFVPGAGIDEIADVIAMLVVDGQIPVGLQERMAGSNIFRRPGQGLFRSSGRDDIFRRPGDDDIFRRG